MGGGGNRLRTCAFLVALVYMSPTYTLKSVFGGDCDVERVISFLTGTNILNKTNLARVLSTLSLSLSRSLGAPLARPHCKFRSRASSLFS